MKWNRWHLYSPAGGIRDWFIQFVSLSYLNLSSTTNTWRIHTDTHTHVPAYVKSVMQRTHCNLQTIESWCNTVPNMIRHPSSWQAQKPCCLWKRRRVMERRFTRAHRERVENISDLCTGVCDWRLKTEDVKLICFNAENVQQCSCFWIKISSRRTHDRQIVYGLIQLKCCFFLE